MKRRLDIGSNFDSKTISSSSKLGKYCPSGVNESSNVNPYTGNPYSSNYYEILKKRQLLPVYEFKDELIDKVQNNQTIVVEGETGSGGWMSQ